MIISFDFKYKKQIIPIECEYEVYDKHKMIYDCEYGIMNGKSEDALARIIFGELEERELSKKVEKLIELIKSECCKQIESDIITRMVNTAEYGSDIER